MKEKIEKIVLSFMLLILPCLFISVRAFFPSIMPSMTFHIFISIWALALCLWLLERAGKKKANLRSFILTYIFWSVIALMAMIVVLLTMSLLLSAL